MKMIAKLKGMDQQSAFIVEKSVGVEFSVKIISLELKNNFWFSEKIFATRVALPKDSFMVDFGNA